MTYRPGQVKRIVEIDLPRPRTSEIVGERCVRPLRRADLGRPARGSEPRHARRRDARARRHKPMSARTRIAQLRCRSRSGFGTLVACHRCVVEVADPRRRDQPLHRADALADRRRVRARHPRGGHRRTASCMTAQRSAVRRALLLAVFGIAHRRAALPRPAAAARDRDLGRGDGVGADRADVSAVPRDLRPQRDDHHHDGLRRGPARR